MATTYVSFTPTEREQARATDLAEFLRRQGYDLRREGRGSVWMNGGEKISVQGNLWYNNIREKAAMRLILHAAFLIARTIRRRSGFCLERMSG